MNNSLKRRLPRLPHIVIVILALISFVVIGGLALLYSTVAPVSGRYTVGGLDAPITIRFDEYERPYVQAQTLSDALFAEGWLHASHRLWQMEMFRRAGKGRLAELLGSGMLESDRELWRTGVPQLARDLAANASPQMDEYVASYIAGVNAAIVEEVSTPPEFLLLRTEAQPWTREDVYAMGALMAFQSANNVGNELLRLTLAAELDVDAMQIFFPDEAGHERFPYVLTGLGEEVSEQLSQLQVRRGSLDPVDTPLFPSFAFGSNGWVVSPEKSATGHALFAFDSHDSLDLPNLFYEVHLYYGDGKELHGWSVAGLPGVINGYNERIAWGFTNIGDSQDLFIETRLEDDPMLFKDGDDWYRAKTETVEIPVNGRDTPEILEVVYTQNGILISDDPPLSLRWTVQDLDGMGLDSLMEFNLATNWEEFTAALDGFAAPSLNATYADVDGNIGFRTAGRLPIRGTGEGLIPLPGDDPSNRWQGYIAPEDMPERLNAEEDFLAAANARVNAPGDGPLISADNAAGYRIRRIKEVLSASEVFTVEDMRALQVDWHDTQAELLLPTLLEALAVNLDQTKLNQDGFVGLEVWRSNPIATPDSAAAMLFQAWYRALAIEVFEPALSEAAFAELMKKSYPLNHALDWLILRAPESDWWRGERREIILQAFLNAIAEVRDKQGALFSNWRLDRMHRVRLDHELGRAVPQLGLFFNADPAPWGGGSSTVGRARYRYDRAYDATAGATVRVVGEMKPSGPEMQAVIPAGQSGHPMSDHYLSQFSVWLAGELLPIPADPSEATWATIELLPN